MEEESFLKSYLWGRSTIMSETEGGLGFLENADKGVLANSDKGGLAKAESPKKRRRKEK